MSSETTLTLTPIGFIRTGKRVKFQARHQPAEADEERNVLELAPGRDFELAARDLAGFERVWLVWWFHRNDGWRPLVLPPRGPARRRGVFATRSPHRPNALGMTPVRLLAVQGRKLILGPCDLVDGTPVFDIKPYVPAYDAFPEARAGWIEEVAAAAAEPARFTVGIAEPAESQLGWLLAEWGVDFRARLIELLSRDPSPHRTRRIRRRESGRMEITCGAWIAAFAVEGEAVVVRAIAPSYPRSFLEREDYLDVPDREAQLAFMARWPD
ncbi:MAG: tRNA (N6-threonylcarbamoyladenosine(37)-N6)-methyltransferase TrmO [Verrucomicrobiota bacterium]